jgi:hypothetical protein
MMWLLLLFFELEGAKIFEFDLQLCSIDYFTPNLGGIT